MNDEPTQSAFSEFTLAGERFAGGRLPVDALAEIERYRLLLLAAAAHSWQAEHPDRDLPDDFGREFDLAITDVRDGSAVSILELPPSIYEEHFDRGRDEIDALFRGIVDNLAVPLLEAAPDADSVAAEGAAVEQQVTEPTESHSDGDDDRPSVVSLDASDYVRYASLPAFRDFGTSLQPGESAQITTPDGAAVVITPLTLIEKIRPLVSMVDDLLTPAKPERHHDENSVAGRLVALNAERQNYTLQTLLYGEVNGRYKSDEMTADLKAVLESSANAPVVRVVGRMSWKSGQLEKILEAQQVELLEVADEPWSRRIVELASLSEGWDEESGGGTTISFGAIELARELLRVARDVGPEAPTAGLFPMQDGGVLVEWTSQTKSISAEVSRDGEIYVHTFVLEPRGSTELETSDLTAAKAAVLEGLA